MGKILQVELLKLKHSKIVWIVILAPMFIVFQGIQNFLRYHDLFTRKGQNIWGKIFEQSMIFYSAMMLSILITLVMTLVARIENSNENWKYFLTLPVKRSKVYISKFVIASGLILINILSFSISMFIGGKLVGAEQIVPYGLIFGKPLMAYLGSFPIMIILYLVSIRFHHAGVPLALGIIGTIPAMLVANTKYWVIYPWTYPIMITLGNIFDKFATGKWLIPMTIGISIILIIFGTKRFAKRDIV